MISVSITETSLLDGLGAFLIEMAGPNVDVTRGLQNRIPSSEKQNFIIVTPLLINDLSTPTIKYRDNPDDGAIIITRPTKWTCQIDCYGPKAHDLSLGMSTALRSLYGCDKLAPSGIQPLFCNQPKQIPFVSGEEQFIERWSFDAVLQFNPSVSFPQQFADTLSVGLIEVDTTFPSGD